MLRKTIAAIGIMVFIASITTINAEAAWRRNDIGWWYTEGSSWATGWRSIDGSWYYFDNNGYMKTGWLLDGGKWYYLNSSGDMRTGWIYLGDKWYYLQSNGAMATESLNINGLWYDFNSNGEWIDNTYVHLQDDFSDSKNINTGYALQNNNENSKQVKEQSNYKSVNAANDASDLSVNESNSTAVSITESEDKTNSKIKKIYNKDELTEYLNTHIVKKHENHMEFYYCGSEPRLGDDSIVDMTAELISNINLKDENLYIRSSHVMYGDTGYNIVKCDLEYAQITNSRISDVSESLTNSSKTEDKSNNTHVEESKSNSISYEEFTEIARNEMLRLVNEHRKENGISELERNDTLEKMATEKSQHMADNNYMDHIYKGIQTIHVQDIAWKVVTSGENCLAEGHRYSLNKDDALKMAESMFEVWKNSYGHDIQMLRESHYAMGFGFAFSEDANTRYYVYATQQFLDEPIENWEWTNATNCTNKVRGGGYTYNDRDNIEGGLPAFK